MRWSPGDGTAGYHDRIHAKRRHVCATRDLFERISAHPKSRLAELLPDQWKAVRVEVDGKEGR